MPSRVRAHGVGRSILRLAVPRGGRKVSKLTVLDQIWFYHNFMAKMRSEWILSEVTKKQCIFLLALGADAQQRECILGVGRSILRLAVPRGGRKVFKLTVLDQIWFYYNFIAKNDVWMHSEWSHKKQCIFLLDLGADAQQGESTWSLRMLGVPFSVTGCCSALELL